ncbi:MAG: DUF6520 family protein [Flavobacteriaceae bacterium]
MKKLKLILPMLAFIFAIALVALQLQRPMITIPDLFQIGTTWYEVDVDCDEVDNNDCKVRLEEAIWNTILYTPMKVPTIKYRILQIRLGKF